MYIPKFLRSTHPDVLAAIEANAAGRAEAHRKACEFASRFGAENGSHYGGRDGFIGGYSIHAVDAAEKPTEGRWKKGPRGYGYAPYANNPLHAEMVAIGYKDVAVPGVPRIVMGDGRIGATTFFTHDGAAWAQVSFTDMTQRSKEEFNLDAYDWEEVLGSEFHAAVEAYNDAAKEGEPS